MGIWGLIHIIIGVWQGIRMFVLSTTLSELKEIYKFNKHKFKPDEKIDITLMVDKTGLKLEFYINGLKYEN